jgi:hypothetical protein
MGTKFPSPIRGPVTFVAIRTPIMRRVVPKQASTQSSIFLPQAGLDRRSVIRRAPTAPLLVLLVCRTVSAVTTHCRAKEDRSSEREKLLLLDQHKSSTINFGLLLPKPQANSVLRNKHPYSIISAQELTTIQKQQQQQKTFSNRSP